MLRLVLKLAISDLFLYGLCLHAVLGFVCLVGGLVVVFVALVVVSACLRDFFVFGSLFLFHFRPLFLLFLLRGRQFLLGRFGLLGSSVLILLLADCFDFVDATLLDSLFFFSLRLL